MKQKIPFFVQVLIGLLVLTIMVSVYFYIQWKRTLSEIQVENINTPEEIAQITAVISTFMQLPVGEEPTIATVLDAEQLRSQPFFVHSKNGDKVLIYIEAKKAILFRPENNRVIEVAPIFFDETGEILAVPEIDNESVVDARAAVTRVVYYNGSGVQGRAAEFEQLVQNTFDTIETVFVTSAFQTYQGIQVVDLSGQHMSQAIELAEFFGGTVVDFPIDESRPDADILIIIGT